MVKIYKKKKKKKKKQTTTTNTEEPKTWKSSLQYLLKIFYIYTRTLAISNPNCSDAKDQLKYRSLKLEVGQLPKTFHECIKKKVNQKMNQARVSKPRNRKSCLQHLSKKRSLYKSDYLATHRYHCLTSH